MVLIVQDLGCFQESTPTKIDFGRQPLQQVKDTTSVFCEIPSQIREGISDYRIMLILPAGDEQHLSIAGPGGRFAPQPPPVPPRTSERAVLPQDILEAPPQRHVDQWIPNHNDNGIGSFSETARTREARERSHFSQDPQYVTSSGFNSEDIQNSLTKMREVDTRIKLTSWSYRLIVRFLM